MSRDRKLRGLNLYVENEGEFPFPDDGRPVVFVENHTNAYDLPYVAEVICKHFYVLAAVDGHTSLTRILSNINGVSYWVERGDSEAAKVGRAVGLLVTIQMLRHGVHHLMYPEGTWNPFYKLSCAILP